MYLLIQIHWSDIFRDSIIAMWRKICHLRYWILMRSIFICSRYIDKSFTNSRFNRSIDKILGTKSIHMKKSFQRKSGLCSSCSKCSKMKNIRRSDVTKNIKYLISIRYITFNPKMRNCWWSWSGSEAIDLSGSGSHKSMKKLWANIATCSGNKYRLW